MSRIHPDRREQVGQDMQDRYYAGSSIRNLVEHYGLAYGTVRKLLLDVETTLRPRGGRRRLQKPKTD